MGWLGHCISKAQHLQSQSLIRLENELSDLTLDGIEHELKLMNVNMAEANDIATLAAFAVIPANLGNDSRRALGLLRDKVMERAKTRTDT